VRALVATLILLFCLGAAAQELQVIELRHRLADDVIPALQPLLEPGGVITGMDGMLFVRTSPGNLEQIRRAVATLDRQPRQLRITVGQGTVATDSRAGVQGSATVGSSDVRVGVNRPPGSTTGITVSAAGRTQHADLRNLSSVTTLEGSETFISVGQSAPVTTTEVERRPGGSTVVQTTGYRSAATGFYATARVQGDLVTLDVSPQQQRFSGTTRDRTVDSAGLATRISGRLGEWIGAGGSSNTNSGASTGLLTWGRRSDASSYSVWVKVEELP
jgi:type II secretory pathway component GspD/PulD (secretin)